MSQHRYQSILARHRYWAAVLLCAAVVLANGCTHIRLQRKTINQGSTLTELQYHQVLDNLAMFACNPDSLAWHIHINGGVVQVADLGSSAIGANLGGPGYVAPNLGMGTNVLHQWNVDPVIESGDLELLHLAYRKAVMPFDPDGSIKREAYDKICEMSGDYHIALTRDVAFDMIETMRHGASDARLARLERIKEDLEELYHEIDEISEKPQRYESGSFASGGVGPPSKLEFLKEEVIRLTSEISGASVEQVGAYYRPGRNVGLVEQAQDKIEALLKLVEETEDGEPNPFSSPWLSHGCKKDVPQCACLVGCYDQCGQECYVWIEPPHMKTFRDFVLLVLSLAPPPAQEIGGSQPGLGAANSPGF